MKNILIAGTVFVGLVAVGVILYSFGYMRLGSNLSSNDQQEIAKTVHGLEEYFASSEDKEGMKRIALIPAQWKTLGEDISNFPQTKVFNFSFRTPYGVGTESAKTKDNANIKQIDYLNDQSVIVSFNKQNAYEELLQVGDAEFAEVFKEYLGENVKSSYKVREFILSVTPAMVLQARSPIEAKAFAQAAVLKDATALDTIIGLYTFETPEAKGFVTVYENAAAVIEFFTQDGGWYNIMIRKADVGTIDSIISSLKIEKSR